MKIILVNPVSMLIEKSNEIKSFLKPIPPLGIAYIAAVLEDNGINAVIIDQYAERMSNHTFIDTVIKNEPDIVAFSCLTPTIKNVSVLVKQIKALNPGIKIILGNIHPTIFASELLREGFADIVVRGEGEYAMPEVVLALEKKISLKGIKGISFIENNTICHNPDRQPIDDLDQIPYPAWHLLDLEKYDCYPMLGLKKKKFLPILASRGCPYRCIFCAQEKIHTKIRYRKVSGIIDEIEFMHKKYNIDCFVFNDPFFPFSIQQGLEFCDELINRGLHKKIIWIAESRVDKVNLELLKAMKNSGAYLIMYGFEVGTQKTLDALKKESSLGQSLEAMRLTKKAGLHTLGLFMLGTPGETRRDCEETIRFSKKLDCTIAKFNIVVPYPGTYLFEKYRKGFNIGDSEKFMSWLDWSPDMSPKDAIYVSDTMSAEELVRLQRKAMFQFYVRPRAILRHLRLTPLKDLCYGAWVLTKQQLRSFRER